MVKYEGSHGGQDESRLNEEQLTEWKNSLLIGADAYQPKTEGDALAEAMRDTAENPEYLPKFVQARLDDGDTPAIMTYPEMWS